MTNNFSTIVDYLFSNHKANARDISDSIEMLKMSLEDSYKEMQTDINEALNGKNLSNIPLLTTYMSDVVEIQNKLDDYLTMFDEKK